jgi:hypothetical protein
VAATSIIDRANDTTRLYNPGNGRAIFGGIRFAL